MKLLNLLVNSWSWWQARKEFFLTCWVAPIEFRFQIQVSCIWYWNLLTFHHECSLVNAKLVINSNFSSQNNLHMITRSRRVVQHIYTRGNDSVILQRSEIAGNGKKLLRQNYAKMRSRCQIRRCQSTTVHL